MSLQLLTRQLFDYAGMFPPAALSFEAALAESQAFPTTLRRPDLVAADMVLTPANAEQMEGKFGRDCKVCIVGVPQEEAVERAAWCHTLGVEVVSLEVHGDTPDLQCLAEAASGLPAGAQLFFEPKWKSDQWTDAGICDLLRPLGIGLKIRCAGPTALDSRALALAISGATLPFKATQGLHHAMAGEHGHGFLNVAVALRLSQGGLDADALQAILEDPEPASFVFDAGIGWQQHRMLAQQLHQVVQKFPFTIGSCSLAEPDDELAAWL